MDRPDWWRGFRVRPGGRCLLVLVLLAVGCKTIGSVRGPAPTPLALAPAEVPAAQAKARELYSRQPRTSARVEEAAALLELVARVRETEMPAQVEAATALAWLASYLPDVAARGAAARRGVVVARRARDLAPAAVEGHYWYALCVGLLADADRSYGLSAVGEMMPSLTRAVELDERYDHGGPLRAMGTLLLRAPGPPVSVGSPRKGLRLLQKAIDHFPAYPENYLYWAEALHVAGRDDEAQQALARLIALPPVTDQQWESERWRAAAAALREQWQRP